jgi:hypothetical protein
MSSNVASAGSGLSASALAMAALAAASKRATNSGSRSVMAASLAWTAAVYSIPAKSPGCTHLERLLDEAPDPYTQGRILDTLVAMHPLSLLDTLIRLARSSRGQAFRVRVESHIAALADDSRLVRLPNDLGHLAYEAAIARNVRFQRKGFRQLVILANGTSHRSPART